MTTTTTNTPTQERPDLVLYLFARRWLLILLPLSILLGLIASSNNLQPERPTQTAHPDLQESQLMTVDGRIVDRDGVEVFTSRPQWATLPGLQATWDAQQAGLSRDAFPPPPDNAEFTVREIAGNAATSRSRHLEYTYPDGAVYTAIADDFLSDGENWRIAFGRYQPPPRHLLAQVTLFALPFAAFGIFLLGVIALIANLSSNSPGKHADKLLTDLTDSSSQGQGSISHLPATGALMRRWLSRSRHHRIVGGLIGVVLYFGVEPYRLLGPQIDLTLFPMFVIGGIAVGAAVAELHLLRRQRTSSSAELHHRAISDYTTAVDRNAMAFIAACSTAVFLASIAGWLDVSPAVALLPAAILAATRALQHFVTVRRRPATSTQLRNADDLVRFLALTRGVTRPAIAAALLALSRIVLQLGTSRWITGSGLALIVLSFVWYLSGAEGRMATMAKAFMT